MMNALGKKVSPETIIEELCATITLKHLDTRRKLILHKSFKLEVDVNKV
jgi:hypothetical protein